MIFNKTLIIAEAGVNHNGDIEIAKKLCLAAKDAGADIVKFQTWITEKIITKEVRKADYQIDNTGSNQSQFDMLKSLELSFSQFAEIKKFCDKINIQFASTADEAESLDFLIDLGIPFIKIGSGELSNIPFLRYCGTRRLPIILSTGMGTLSDVETAINALTNGGATDISLLHCTSNYPCPFDKVNLRAMQTLRNAFGYSVGYSDHTQGIEVPIAAVSLGATVIEKHLTLDKNMSGPDHKASTEPNEFREMVQSIKNVKKCLGDGFKIPTDTEKEISKVVLKHIVANRFIPKGKVIEEDDISVKRSSCGLPAKAWDIIIGTRARQDFYADEGIVI